ncbi:MAG TPA: methionine gamma-lyase family protein [Clostridiaceae bacterium]|jgi:aluminum resistance protein|nr:aluminum resistance family protein [Clostridium sp. CAG:452]HJJ03306.1 methionine gamma-lyase family protein [Clostridiaceae bacterium]
MYKEFGIKEDVIELSKKIEKDLDPIFKEVEEIEECNSLKVLSAFQKYNLSEMHFNGTTGYGYGDIGRDTIESIFADIFKAEDSLVRTQFISGTHAISTLLFGILRPNDTLISISGKPYDTLDEVIGIVENKSSLQSYGVKYEQIELVNDDFDYKAIEERVKKGNIKLIEIQRSRGYSTRKTIDLEKVEKVIKLIKDIDRNIIVMIDNCYCEFVTKKEPIEVGADVVVGSLIKNLGGGIAPNGGYIAGRKDIVELAAERLTAPGLGKEVGPSLGINKQILQGLFFAPQVVASSLKTAIFASRMLEELGYNVEPKFNDKRADIVQTIEFNDREKLIKFCQGIQAASPVDSNSVPMPWDMPGYTDQVIMAAGAFTQGSSIELSCDGPIRPPYTAFLQGGLTYGYGKLGILKAISRL